MFRKIICIYLADAKFIKVILLVFLSLTFYLWSVFVRYITLYYCLSLRV